MKTQYINQCEVLVRVDLKFACSHDLCHLIYYGSMLRFSHFFLFLQGKASGNEAALWLRAPIQYELFKLGCRLQRHAGKVLFLGILILAILSVGMKSATLETRVEKLWVQGKQKRKIFKVHYLLSYIVTLFC